MKISVREVPFVHRLLSVAYLKFIAKMFILKFSIDEESLINFDDHSEINILAAAAAFRDAIYTKIKAIINVRFQHIRSRSINLTSEWQKAL